MSYKKRTCSPSHHNTMGYVDVVRMQRQAPFLRSVLRQADANKRKQLLQLANADQINTISELVLNVLKGHAPRSRYTLERLRPHSQALRDMSKRRSSIKRRRQVMIDQKGAGLWKELHQCHRKLVPVLPK